MSLAAATSSLSIKRVTALTPDVYNYAVAAYKLLFAPRALDPTAIPADLTEFEEFYCNPDKRGCFLVARDSSLPSPSSTPSETTSSFPTTSSSGQAVEAPIVGILAYKPYVHRFLDDEGKLRPEMFWSGLKTVEVVRLFVSPECRGKRLAQRLVEAMVEEAKRDGVQVLYLHTQPFLTGAEELWRKMGWELIARDKDQWESIHMVRKL